MTSAVILRAIEEITQEDFKKNVELEKTRIRRRRAMPWWCRIIPFRVRIERIDT